MLATFLATFLATMLATAFAGDAVAGGLYRWTDADGNVQYSDRPPPEETRDYVGPERQTVGEALELEERIEREREAREREAARQAAERQAALEASAPKDKIHSRYSCEEARRFAEHYAKPGQEFFTRGENGFVRSTPQQVAATEAEWRAAAEVLCQDDVEIVQNEPE